MIVTDVQSEVVVNSILAQQLLAHPEGLVKLRQFVLEQKGQNVGSHLVEPEFNIDK